MSLTTGPQRGPGCCVRSGPVGRILLRATAPTAAYDDHPSRPVVADRLKPPTRAHRAGHPFRPRPVARLFGVAPGGGYRVSRPRSRPRLLVSVALFLALGIPENACCVRPLAVTLPCGVRTFLSCIAAAAAAQPPSLVRIITGSPSRANGCFVDRHDI